MRIFISINPDSEIKEKIYAGQKQFIDFLGDSAINVKWEEINKFHLTMLFIGEVERQKIYEVIKQLEMIQNVAEIEFKGTSAGAFPNLRNPRVLWAGLESKDKKSELLYSKIIESLEPLGIEQSNKFHPHITLGRVKKPFLLKEIPQIKCDFSFVAYSFNLMQSTLTPAGSVFKLIKQFNL